MSQIVCSCGNVIYEKRKPLSNKAIYISDKYTNEVADLLGEDILSLIEENSGNIDSSDIGDLIWSRMVFELANDIYECDKCGRLIVQKNNGETNFMVFKPENSFGEKCINSGLSLAERTDRFNRSNKTLVKTIN